MTYIVRLHIMHDWSENGDETTRYVGPFGSEREAAWAAKMIEQRESIEQGVETYVESLLSITDWDV